MSLDLTRVAKLAEEMIQEALSKENEGEALLIKVNMVNKLKNIHEAWQEALNKINEAYEKERKSARDELDRMTQVLNKAKLVVNEVPVKEEKKATTVTWAELAESEAKGKPIVKIAQKKSGMFHIADDVTVMAYEIEKLEECHKYRGYLCWCKSVKKFVFSLNDMVYSGLTTEIYDANKKPFKFIEHEESEKIDYRSTPFYVPQERNPESQDVRILTNRMQYVSIEERASSRIPYSYSLADRRYLRRDLDHMEESDFRLAQDITMNFLLCLVAANGVITERRKRNRNA